MDVNDIDNEIEKLQQKRAAITGQASPSRGMPFTYMNYITTNRSNTEDKKEKDPMFDDDEKDKDKNGTADDKETIYHDPDDTSGLKTPPKDNDGDEDDYGTVGINVGDSSDVDEKADDEEDDDNSDYMQYSNDDTDEDEEDELFPDDRSKYNPTNHDEEEMDYAQNSKKKSNLQELRRLRQSIGFSI